MKKEEKGITLIALIITIILLLILAGITLIQLTNNGLFKKAKLSKVITEYKTAKEIIEMKLMEIQTDCTINLEEYNLAKIAQEMEIEENITIEKYYYSDNDIEENISNLKGIVVSVNQYSKYKFLIGEKCEIKGVLMEEITEKTEISDFKTIEEFEKDILNIYPENNEDNDKISEAYYLYYKGNEYKEIAGEWVNNEKVSESATGKLTKEKEYMIYEAGTAYYQNPICTKELTMDISAYDVICAEVELIGENGGTSNRNVTFQVVDKNGIVQKYEHNHGLGVNGLAIGEIKTISMNIQEVENLNDVYFGISLHGYKIKIHSIYLKKVPPFKIMVSDDNGNYSIDGKIINGDGSEIKKDIDGREIINLDGTKKYIKTESLTNLAGNTEKTIMCMVRTTDTIQDYRGIIKLGDDSFKGSTFSIHHIGGYYRFDTGGYTYLYDPRKDFISDDNWHFICVSYNGSELCLYFDDKLLSKTENATLVNINNPILCIGSTTLTGSGYFDGDISDIRIYNKGLNIEEINTIYEEIKK